MLHSQLGCMNVNKGGSGELQCYWPVLVWYAPMSGRRQGTMGAQRPGPKLPAAAEWRHLPSGVSVNSPHYPENHCLGQNHLNHLQEERATIEILTLEAGLYFKLCTLYSPHGFPVPSLWGSEEDREEWSADSVRFFNLMAVVSHWLQCITQAFPCPGTCAPPQY